MLQKNKNNSYDAHYFHCALQDSNRTFEWVEFFAGNAEATKQMKGYGGHTTARLDVTYMCSKTGRPNTNPMDICSDSGMAILGWKHYIIYILIDS